MTNVKWTHTITEPAKDSKSRLEDYGFVAKPVGGTDKIDESKINELDGIVHGEPKELPWNYVFGINPDGYTRRDLSQQEQARALGVTTQKKVPLPGLTPMEQFARVERAESEKLTDKLRSKLDNVKDKHGY